MKYAYLYIIMQFSVNYGGKKTLKISKTVLAE